MFRGRLLLVTVILNLGVMLHAIDVFVIVAILPTVVGEIGGAGFYSWSIMIYMVASIVGAASAARLSSNLNQRRAFVLAAVLFLIGTTGTGLAPTMSALLLGRFVQGLGGGLVLSLCYQLIRAVYPPSLQTLAITSVSGIWGIAALLGPLFGGVMAELGWWRGAFLIRTPILVAFVVAAWYAVPATQVDAVGRWPWRRLLLLSVGVMLIGLTGQLVAAAGKAGLLLAAIAVIALMLRLDGAAPNRLFPSHPLSLSHKVGVSYWMIFLYSTCTGQVSIFIPLGVQALHGVSALYAGYFQAGLALSWTAAAILVARFSGRRIDFTFAVGMPVATAGLATLAWFATPGPLWAIAVGSCAIGFGIGFCHAHLVAGAMQAARPGEEGVTAGAIPMTQSLGIAVGAAMAGIVANFFGMASGLDRETVATAVPMVYAVALASPLLAMLASWRLLSLRARRADDGDVAVQVQAGGGQADL
ncbi:MAG: MFS transporter [Alphaproteobacteria bacterium]